MTCIRLNGDGCCPGEDPDSGGDLSAGLDCRGEQTTDRGQLSIGTLGCFVRTDWAGIRKGQLRVLCYQYGGESESGLQPAGSPANWRCIVLEKLSRVKLLDDAWRTAPNHSRPASCVVERRY